MVLGVLERPIDFLYDTFDRIENLPFLVKYQLDFDRGGQTIEPLSHCSDLTFWNQICYLVHNIILRLSA